MSDHEPVGAGGRRVAARSATPPGPGRPDGRRDGRRALRLLGLGAAVTALVVAWGYLVLAAIDAGARARDGRTAAWAVLAVAAVGAMACLFLALLAVVRLVRLVLAPPPDRPAGGRRAAR